MEPHLFEEIYHNILNLGIDFLEPKIKIRSLVIKADTTTTLMRILLTHCEACTILFDVMFSTLSFDELISHSAVMR